MTKHQMKRRLWQAFQNATPALRNPIPAVTHLSDIDNRKGDEKSIKPVENFIQFRVMTILVAGIAAVIVIAGALFLWNPNTNHGVAAQSGDTTAATITNSKITPEEAIKAAKDVAEKQLDNLSYTTDWEWEYKKLGDIMVYEFEINLKPYDFIIQVQPHGVVYFFEDEVVLGNSGNTFIGIDSALEAVNDYAADKLSLPELTKDSMAWELDEEDGAYFYKIDIRNGNQEIAFTVNTSTGAVVGYDVETMEAGAQGYPATLPSNTFSEEQIIHIALDYCGFKKENTSIQIEEDFDDAIPHYDLELKSHGWEYNFEISLQDGTILNVEKEIFDASEVLLGTQPPDGKIGKNLAIKIALESLGVTIAQVHELECEEDTKDKQRHYDVTFDFNGYAYEIEIGMYNPCILSTEKEPIG